MAISIAGTDTAAAEIIGYVEPWVASPGEKIDVKVGANALSPQKAPSPFSFIRCYTNRSYYNTGLMHRRFV